MADFSEGSLRPSQGTYITPMGAFYFKNPKNLTKDTVSSTELLEGQTAESTAVALQVDAGGCLRVSLGGVDADGDEPKTVFVEDNALLVQDRNLSYWQEAALREQKLTNLLLVWLAGPYSYGPAPTLEAVS